MTQTGFPHSEISGLTVVCTYPKLIAACHVLHRLHVPRHPPYALSSFTKGSWSREWSMFIKINKDSQLFSVTKWSYRLPHSLQKTIHICESTSIPNFQKTMWWSWQGSNLRPSECKSDALPTELQPQYKYFGSRPSGPAWTRTTDLILIRDAL